MKISCDIIQDLIPLVNDNVASEDSKKTVFEHCQECAECMSLLENNVSFNSEQINIKWKKKIRFSMFGFTLLLALLACSFTATKNMFSNILLMPVIGGLGYGLLRRKVYLIYLFIFIIQFLYQIISFEFHFGFMIYTVIYYVLLSFGIAIYFCFWYVFKGGKQNEN